MCIHVRKNYLIKKHLANKLYPTKNIVLMNIYIYKRIHFGNPKTFLIRHILFGHK